MIKTRRTKTWSRRWRDTRPTTACRRRRELFEICARAWTVDGAAGPRTAVSDTHRWSPGVAVEEGRRRRRPAARRYV